MTIKNINITINIRGIKIFWLIIGYEVTRGETKLIKNFTEKETQ